MAFPIIMLSLHVQEALSKFCPDGEYQVGTGPAATVVPHPALSLQLSDHLSQTTSLLQISEMIVKKTAAGK